MSDLRKTAREKAKELAVGATVRTQQEIQMFEECLIEFGAMCLDEAQRRISGMFHPERNWGEIAKLKRELEGTK